MSWVTTAAAQPLSMAIHQLATHAVKRGALSVAAGRLSVTCARAADGGLCLSRVEEGGPPVLRIPDRRGFASRVIRGTIDQLGGRLACTWPETGLVCQVYLPEGRWHASRPPASDPDPDRPRAAGG
jgi:two-component sensor histidine kinase